ncbi:MAG: cytochrome C [Burkholderiaceae bacterium]|nr:cytochrome C [Burkholderiaceae bacterium]
MSIALLLATTLAHAAVDVGRAKALLSQNACLGCHSVSSRLVGPSYHEVGEKYKGGDPATLAARIRSGGTGKWGQLEMPPQTNLSAADARVLAEWILAGSPDQ